MNYQQATDLVNALDRTVTTTKPELIQEVFSALVFLDSYWIVHRAELFLAELHQPTFKILADEDDLAHRLTMDVFYASLHEYAQDKPAEVDLSVEHDIPNWIDGNAAIIALANIRIMEAALPTKDIYAHRTLIELHRNIDFSVCEDEQNAALQRAWVVIQARIDAFLAEALNK